MERDKDLDWTFVGLEGKDTDDVDDRSSADMTREERGVLGTLTSVVTDCDARNNASADARRSARELFDLDNEAGWAIEANARCGGLGPERAA